VGLPHRGYEIAMSIEIPVSGMTCGGCVAALRKALDRDGLQAVVVELGVARVPDAGDVSRVKVVVERCGFGVEEQGTSPR
jgi:copper chaperone CopZ